MQKLSYEYFTTKRDKWRERIQDLLNAEVGNIAVMFQMTTKTEPDNHVSMLHCVREYITILIFLHHILL
jgi:hypothetical protein